jgi:putative transposase
MNKTKEFFKRKINRIGDFAYKGGYAYFIIICTSEKQPYLTSEDLINYLLLQLREETNRFLFKIYTYCFMPNHLHLLLVGEEKSNLLNCMKMFKQKTGYYFKQKNNKKLWQKSFFDHVLRKWESINELALYIFDNPVRKGLVDDFRKYPYLGSDLMNLEDAYELYRDHGSVDVDILLRRENL